MGKKSTKHLCPRNMKNSHKFQKKRQPITKRARNCTKENTHSIHPLQLPGRCKSKAHRSTVSHSPPPRPPLAHRKADGLTGECGRGSRSWLCWGGGCGCKLAQPLSYPLKLTPHTSQLWTYYVTPQQPLKTYSNTTGQSNWKTLNCQVTHGRKGKKEKTEKWNTVGTQTENYK